MITACRWPCCANVYTPGHCRKNRKCQCHPKRESKSALDDKTDYRITSGGASIVQGLTTVRSPEDSRELIERMTK